MPFKMKYSSPFNLINKGEKDNTKKGGRMSEAEAAKASAKPDMQVEITAKEVTKKAGQSLPSSDISKGRKVFERPAKRTFGDVAISKKEKMGKKGAEYAKTKTASVQTVKIK